MAKDDSVQRGSGISRRDLLRRGAVVGGTLLWATPVIQSITTPAYAQEVTPACHTCCCCTKAIPTPLGLIRCFQDNFSPATCAAVCAAGGAGVQDFCGGRESAAGNAATGDCTCTGQDCEGLA